MPAASWSFNETNRWTFVTSGESPSDCHLTPSHQDQNGKESWMRLEEFPSVWDIPTSGINQETPPNKGGECFLSCHIRKNKQTLLFRSVASGSSWWIFMLKSNCYQHLAKRNDVQFCLQFCWMELTTVFNCFHMKISDCGETFNWYLKRFWSQTLNFNMQTSLIIYNIRALYIYLYIRKAIRCFWTGDILLLAGSVALPAPFTVLWCIRIQCLISLTNEMRETSSNIKCIQTVVDHCGISNSRNTPPKQSDLYYLKKKKLTQHHASIRSCEKHIPQIHMPHHPHHEAGCARSE